MVLSLYLSRESCDLDEIWCADSIFGSKNGHVLIYKKNMKFKMADRRHIENRLLAIFPRVIVRLMRYFLCTSRTMLRHTPRDENSNFRKFKKVSSLYLAADHPISMKFGVPLHILVLRTVTWQSMKILQIQNGGRPFCLWAIICRPTDLVGALSQSPMSTYVDCYTRINQRSVPTRNS